MNPHPPGFRTLAWIAWVCLTACSGDDDSPPDVADAGPDAAEAGPDGAVPAPEAPAPPVLTPCPPGWTEVAGDVPTCTPFPDGPANCGPDEAYFPGTAGCARVGAACPAGDFAATLPGDAVVWYVGADAAGGGDGSLGAPFDTIAAATRAAASGDVVALSRGTFHEGVELPEGVTLWGACVAETRVVADRPVGSAGAITVVGADTTIRNLTVAGPGPGVWVEGRDAAVDLQDIVIADTSFVGLLVGGGAAVTGHSVVVREVRSEAVPGVSGVGAMVDTRGWLELEGAVIERTDGTAIVALGTHVALRDAAVVDGLGSEPPGRGLDAQLGADVELTRAWLSGQRDVALLAFDLDTVLRLQDVVVRETAPDAAGDAGRGLSLVDGARAEIRRALFEGQREVAVLVDRAGSTAVLEDAVIQDTLGREEAGTGGSGLAVQGGASVTLTRVRLARTRGAGLFAIGPATTLTLADVAIVGTRGLAADGDQGSGLHVQGAQVEGARLLVDDNRQAGVLAIAEATVSLEDLDVTGTRERDCAQDGCAGVGFGDGLITSLGSTVTVRRFRILQSARVGVTLESGALDLHDGEVAGCPIGASVQAADYDLARLYDGVVFHDNDRNLDRSSLPVPEPVAGF